VHSDIYNLQAEKHRLKWAEAIAAFIRALVLLLIFTVVRVVVGHPVGWVRWIPIGYLLLEVLVIFAETLEEFGRNYLRSLQRLRIAFTHMFTHEAGYESEKEYLEELEKKKQEKSKAVHEKKKDK